MVNHHLPCCSALEGHQIGASNATTLDDPGNDAVGKFRLVDTIQDQEELETLIQVLLNVPNPDNVQCLHLEVSNRHT
jgi:hypothetical protein